MHREYLKVSGNILEFTAPGKFIVAVNPWLVQEYKHQCSPISYVVTSTVFTEFPCKAEAELSTL